MTFSVTFLQVLVIGALILCAVAAVALVVMLVADYCKKSIW